jgi:hypothetical protein
MPVFAAGEGGDVGYQVIQVAGSLLILAGFAAAQAGRLSIDSLLQLVRGRPPTAPGH